MIPSASSLAALLILLHLLVSVVVWTPDLRLLKANHILSYRSFISLGLNGHSSVSPALQVLLHECDSNNDAPA